MNAHLWRLPCALLVAATPFLVTSIASRVAAAEARTAGTIFAPSVAQLRSLAAATGLAALVLAGGALALPGGPLLLLEAITFIALAGLSLFVLADIEGASRRASELPNRVRDAALMPRTVGAYLPLALRAVPFLIAIPGIGTYLLRLASPAEGRHILLPSVMAFAGVTYFLLYETWMRQEVVRAGDEARRARRVVLIQRAEVALVAIFILLAHALLDVDWATRPALGLAGGLVGGIVGVIAGAFAVASEYGQRRYQPT